jgi:uncharacterized membrane protein YhhN
MKFDKLFLNLFLVAAIVHLYAFASMMYQAEMITKYLMMPMLILHVIVNSRKKLSDVFLLLIALLFCWFGDIILMYTADNDNYFLFGLAAFLIAHLFYIFTFRKFRYADQKTNFKIGYAIPVLIYSGGLMAYLIPHLGDMLIPVIAYAIVISIMVVVALMRMVKTTSYSFSFVLYGAILFVISDSIIAVNKFTSPITNAGLFIMVTYIMAQYLIVNGCLLHLKEED